MRRAPSLPTWNVFEEPTPSSSVNSSEDELIGTSLEQDEGVDMKGNGATRQYIKKRRGASPSPSQNEQHRAKMRKLSHDEGARTGVKSPLSQMSQPLPTKPQTVATAPLAMIPKPKLNVRPTGDKSAAKTKLKKDKSKRSNANDSDSDTPNVRRPTKKPSSRVPTGSNSQQTSSLQPTRTSSSALSLPSQVPPTPPTATANKPVEPAFAVPALPTRPNPNLTPDKPQRPSSQARVPTTPSSVTVPQSPAMSNSNPTPSTSKSVQNSVTQSTPPRVEPPTQLGNSASSAIPPPASPARPAEPLFLGEEESSSSGNEVFPLTNTRAAALRKKMARSSIGDAAPVSLSQPSITTPVRPPASVPISSSQPPPRTHKATSLSVSSDDLPLPSSATIRTFNQSNDKGKTKPPNSSQNKSFGAVATSPIEIVTSDEDTPRTRRTARKAPTLLRAATRLKSRRVRDGLSSPDSDEDKDARAERKRKEKEALQPPKPLTPQERQILIEARDTQLRQRIGDLETEIRHLAWGPITTQAGNNPPPEPEIIFVSDDDEPSLTCSRRAPTQISVPVVAGEVIDLTLDDEDETMNDSDSVQLPPSIPQPALRDTPPNVALAIEVPSSPVQEVSRQPSPMGESSGIELQDLLQDEPDRIDVDPRSETEPEYEDARLPTPSAPSSPRRSSPSVTLEDGGQNDAPPTSPEEMNLFRSSHTPGRSSPPIPEEEDPQQSSEDEEIHVTKLTPPVPPLLTSSPQSSSPEEPNVPSIEDERRAEDLREEAVTKLIIDPEASECSEEDITAMKSPVRSDNEKEADPNAHNVEEEPLGTITESTPAEELSAAAGAEGSGSEVAHGDELSGKRYVVSPPRFHLGPGLPTLTTATLSTMSSEPAALSASSTSSQARMIPTLDSVRNLTKRVHISTPRDETAKDDFPTPKQPLQPAVPTRQTESDTRTQYAESSDDAEEEQVSSLLAGSSLHTDKPSESEGEGTSGGGPFWADYSALEYAEDEEDEPGEAPKDMIQPAKIADVSALSIRPQSPILVYGDGASGDSLLESPPPRQVGRGRQRALSPPKLSSVGQPDEFVPQILRWSDYRANIDNFKLDIRFTRDLPHSLQDMVNSMPEYYRTHPDIRFVFEGMIQDSVADEDPGAPKIILVNDVDGDPAPPFEFTYTNKMWQSDDVRVSSVKDLKGCSCVGPCAFDDSCECFKRQKEWTGEYGMPHFIYDEEGRVPPGMEQIPIFECNMLCGCDEDCRNRVVQKGRRVDVVIEKTSMKGWGVFARQFIPAGTFIGIYAGELITYDEGEDREQLYNIFRRTYLFDLDFGYIFEHREDKTPLYCVDAYHAGNFTRFLNHSCEPNCYLLPVYINEPDIDKPLLTVFTKHAVQDGEELCFSYHGDIDDEEASKMPPSKSKRGRNKQSKSQRQAPDVDPIHVPCMCGASRCTTVMFKT